MIGTLGQFVREIRDKLAGAGDPIPVNIGGATLSVTADGVEIKNDAGNPVPVATGLTPLTDTQLRATPVQVVSTIPARIPTTTSVASSTSSVTILAANANRRGVSIFNDSTATLRLSFSTPATAANAFIGLPAGAFLLLDQQLIVGGAIYGIWASANGTAQVTEFA